jgi:hypothetical protein
VKDGIVVRYGSEMNLKVRALDSQNLRQSELEAVGALDDQSFRQSEL